LNAALGEVVRVMSRSHGRDISLYEEAFLAKSIERRLAATGHEAVTAYAGYLSEDSTEAEILLRALNITFSEFFRSLLTFSLLEQVILPSLAAKMGIAGRAEMRVWSAACGAGQEAYSIAILLDELAASGRIFATDRSGDEIAAAQEGVYDYASVHKVRLKHVRDYFTQAKESYAVAATLRGRVDFSVYDLLDDSSLAPSPSIYGEFDLVLCSNVLFYYRPEVRRRILTKAWNSLRPGGYLVTSEAEREIVAGHESFRAAFPLFPVFRKTGL
jgi:chemotaxis methyl-accepting protein methylase